MAEQRVAIHPTVSHDEWLAARRRHLEEEKEFTRRRDRLSQERRELPWEAVEKDYVFDGPNGRRTLADLFQGRGQLVIYHAMFDPASASPKTTWTEDAACMFCSWWLDNLNGIVVHLEHRDVTMAAVSRAPYPKIAAYSRRMGWSFDWYSSGDGDFNSDYGVSFTAGEIAEKATVYNFGTAAPFGTEAPGISVFAREGEKVFHTYSTYGRGLDMLNVAYHYLDLVPDGRNEDQGIFWVRRHDEYEA